MRAYKKVSSYDLYAVSAFSLCRIWGGEFQWMNDVWPSTGCYFYQAENAQEAAVFNPRDEFTDDGTGFSVAAWFEGTDDHEGERDHDRYLFVEREIKEINIDMGD